LYIQNSIIAEEYYYVLIIENSNEIFGAATCSTACPTRCRQGGHRSRPGRSSPDRPATRPHRRMRRAAPAPRAAGQADERAAPAPRAAGQ
jgi:hypothetical protein